MLLLLVHINVHTHTSDCVALGWFGDVGFIGPLGFEVAWFMFSERSFFIFGFQIYGEPGKGLGFCYSLRVHVPK